MHLAKLHSPLVERVDAPNEALDCHTVLVQSQQLKLGRNGWLYSALMFEHLLVKDELTWPTV